MHKNKHGLRHKHFYFPLIYIRSQNENFLPIKNENIPQRISHYASAFLPIYRIIYRKETEFVTKMKI